MPKNVRKAKDLKGLNIYQDRHHGTVYYDFVTKNGYILCNEDVRKYILSVAFFPVAIVIFYFSLQLKLSTLTSALIAIGFYIIAQIVYRFAFLYKLPCVENYNKSNNTNFIDNLSEKYSKPRLIVLIVFLIALIATMSLYILTSDFIKNIQIALWMLVALVFVFLIITIIALKNKK